jgi:phosphonate transport system ATP-binding protein
VSSGSSTDLAAGRERPVIALKGVTVKLGDVTALADVDLEIRAGERVALVGPSGAGKTTLLMVVNGAVPPSGGTVTVLGQRMAELGRRQGRRLRSVVGTVYQQLHLPGALQVVHNVNAGRLAAWSLPRSLWSLLRPVELESASRALDRVGIADKLRERTDRLSGGEQQRVAIARVLVQDPVVILADEPISSLDPTRGLEVMGLLTALARESGRALVVSLHAFDVARSYCDRVVGLRDGAVLFDLPAAEVTDSMGRELYQLSAG